LETEHSEPEWWETGLTPKVKNTPERRPKPPAGKGGSRRGRTCAVICSGVSDR